MKKKGAYDLLPSLSALFMKSLCKMVLSYQARLLWIKFPSWDQVLHYNGIITSAKAVVKVKLMSLLNLL